MEIIWYNCLTWLHFQTAETMTAFVNRVPILTKTEKQKKMLIQTIKTMLLEME